MPRGALATDGRVDWLRFWEGAGIAIIPRVYGPHDTAGTIAADLPAIVEQVLRRSATRPEQGERAWTVVRHRFGLQGVAKLTLEDLGAAYGLTRERIRQIEVQALGRLRAVLFEQQYAGLSFHVHPRVIDTVQLLCRAVADETSQLVGEGLVLERVRAMLDSETDTLAPMVNLLFALAGYERITFDDPDLEPVWGYIEKSQRTLLEAMLPRVHQIVTRETVLPLREIELLIRVNKHAPKAHKLVLAQLQWLLGLCNTIERRDDGTVWSRFRYIEGRGNQVERLLTESGQPTDFRALAREINHRTVRFGRDAVEPVNVRNQMIADGRFVAVGNSGRWGLKIWTHVETRTITALMEECLTITNTPVTVEEIHAYVAERRPAKLGSIAMYLHAEKAFVRTDRTRWGLHTWVEAQRALTWDRAQVADFVAGIFRERRAKELDVKVVCALLATAAGVTEKQARGLLAQNPVTASRNGRTWDERIAIFQPDYKERLAAKGRPGQALTLHDRVATAVRALLEAQPTNELPLPDVIAALMAEFSRPKPTMYQYVGRLDFVETVAVPGSQTKVCRLRGVAGSLPFLEAQRIGTAALRQGVERALRKLTEDDVDLGLFLLSKEFEATLKRYLTLATARGQLAGNLGKDPEKWKLVAMVDAARQNGIVQDSGAFQYLREQRNDRAHGAMPTREERRLMLQTAPHFAGMYVGYIRLLDDRAAQP